MENKRINYITELEKVNNCQTFEDIKAQLWILWGVLIVLWLQFKKKFYTDTY